VVEGKRMDAFVDSKRMDFIAENLGLFLAGNCPIVRDF
jgi:hypothetical protein